MPVIEFRIRIEDPEKKKADPGGPALATQWAVRN
jgi:hypothetical protein